MRVTNMRRGLVALVAATLLTAGCSVNDDGALVFNEDLSGDLSDFGCDKVGDARDALQGALDAPEESGQRNRVDDFGLDPSSEEEIKQKMAELDERSEICDNEAPEASESPSPSPSESPSEPTDTSSPSEDESIDNGLDPADIVGWDQFVEDAPEGLEQSIADNSSETGFDWADVETWAEASMPQGKLVDARVAVVFGRLDLTDTEVREQTDVAQDVPVVRAERCYTDLNVGDEVCFSGDDRLRVVLAPVVMDGAQVAGLQPETGVLLAEGFPLVTYNQR